MTFDARANGYVRTDGIAGIVIARDDVSGVTLSATAVRSDGRSASLTAPNGGAQRSLMLAAWALCAMSAAEIGCIEAHGTGTGLGDPTEAGSLAATLARGADALSAFVGAAKASIGHTEAPSGVKGLLKARRILDGEPVASGNAHLRVLNPLIRERLGVRSAFIALPTCSVPLSASTDSVGVNSFGFSGTIVHALLKRCAVERAALPSRKRPAVTFARQSFTWGSTAPRPASRLTMYSACWSTAPSVESGTASSMLVLTSGRGGAITMPESAVRTVALEACPTRGSALSLDSLRAALLLAQRLTYGIGAAKLMLITSGAQPAAAPLSSSHIGGASHGGMWGFARVLRLEQPSMQVVSVDVPPGSERSAVSFSSVGTESELAMRGVHRLVSRLRAGEAVRMVRNPAAVRGTYVITGGLGGLGLRAAELVLDRGARSVVLASRSGRVARGGQGLEAQLSSVRRSALVLACDSADGDEVLALLRASLDFGAGSVRGILHTAGIPDKGLLSEMHRYRFEVTAAPKAGGAWRLHQHVSSLRLDALVQWSSVGAAFGNAGQGTYTLSNSYLDGLTLCRRAQGNVAACMQWPLITGAGMGAAGISDKQARSRGMAAISIDEYAAGLLLALTAGARMMSRAHVPLPSDVAEMLESVSDSSQSLYAEIEKPKRTASLPVAAAAARVLDLDSVMEMVRSYAEGTVDADIDLIEAGVDSLGAVELRTQLQTAAGVQLPSTLMFDYPTARQIAALLPTEVPVAASISARAFTESSLDTAGAKECVVVQLPGFDGSHFHFKALTEWLKASGLPIELFNVEVPEHETTLAGWMSETAEQLAKALSGRSPKIVLLGYSAGANFAPLLVDALRSFAIAIDALILMDPGHIFHDGLGEVTAEDVHAAIRGMGVRIIATSVMSDIPEDLDLNLARTAMLEAFPTYARRFADADAIERYHVEMPSLEGDNYALGEIPTLLVVSTEEHPYFSGVTGGAKAAEDWSMLCPHALVSGVSGIDQSSSSYVEASPARRVH